MKKVIATLAVAALSLVGVFAEGRFGAASATAAPARKPPKVCVAALEATERLDTASSQVFAATADFLSRVQQEADRASAGGVNISTITTFLVGIKQGEDDLTSRLVELTDDVANARFDYTTAATKCRKGK
jgi:hypothetical protein